MVVENVFTTESLQDDERRVNVLPQTMETELLREGDKRKLQIDIANLLDAYINIVHDTVNIVQMSYDTVMDKVFRHTVAEKDQTTEKLALMSEEERIADTMLKINKLGDWGKGLRKGIISYDADVYDEEREQMAKIQETQKLLLQRPEVEERNLEQYMQDYNRELEDAAEIDVDEAERRVAEARTGMEKAESRKIYIENQLTFDREQARIEAYTMWKNSAGGPPTFGG